MPVLQTKKISVRLKTMAKNILPLVIIIAIIAVLIVGVYFLFSYDGSKVEEKEEAVEDTTYTLEDNQLKNKKMTAIITTSLGNIELELFSDKAPNTVANFVKLAKEGFYDNTKFHRVIKGFMIQGGDPLSKDDANASRWGTGGPGYQFADEIYSGNSNVIGSIAMANSGPNTNGSQFFINTNDNDFLDSKHTVFGRVVSGIEVVKAIENTSVGDGDRPNTPIIFQSIKIIE